jgi:hypothetical protein
LPDPTWPKIAEPELASTFCIPATGINVIDTVAGLPGPGTVTLPATVVWSKD